MSVLSSTAPPRERAPSMFAEILRQEEEEEHTRARMWHAFSTSSTSGTALVPIAPYITMEDMFAEESADENGGGLDGGEDKGYLGGDGGGGGESVWFNSPLMDSHGSLYVENPLFRGSFTSAASSITMHSGGGSSILYPPGDKTLAKQQRPPAVRRRGGNVFAMVRTRLTAFRSSAATTPHKEVVQEEEEEEEEVDENSLPAHLFQALQLQPVAAAAGDRKSATARVQSFRHRTSRRRTAGSSAAAARENDSLVM